MTVVTFPMAFTARRMNASRATDRNVENGGLRRGITSDFRKTATSRSAIHLIPTRQLHAATKIVRTLAVETSY